MSKNIAAFFLSLSMFLANTGCQPGDQGEDTSKASALLGYFTNFTPADTVHFLLDSAPMTAVQEVPVQALYSALDSVLFFQMGYMQDTAAMKALAHSRFPLDADHDAALLELREGWFAFKYLLIFNKSTGQFTRVTPVCEFYGGDGGQIRSESWLFFKEPSQVLTRFSERWLQMGTEEDPDNVQEKFHETMRLQEWAGMEWQEVSVSDSSLWVKNFPVQW